MESQERGECYKKGKKAHCGSVTAMPNTLGKDSILGNKWLDVTNAATTL